MHNAIHQTAIIDPSAIIGENTQIGPYSLIGANVEIGSNCKIAGHVVIETNTILGSDCQVSPGAVIGGPPQDLSYKDEFSRVRVGNGTRIRECVTLNRATGEGTETVIGNDCFLMAYSHLAHNCQLGNNVILANAVQVGGHVELGDYVFIGGASVVHQNVRIGRMAFMGGACATRQDLPPFSMSDGRPSAIQGINSVGLKRRGFTLEQRQRIKKAFFHFWFSDLNYSQAIETIRETIPADDYVQELIDFVLSSKRGINDRRLPASQSDESTDQAALDAVEV
jgi:UDP-N-acetylglucosamine acyltransferase